MASSGDDFPISDKQYQSETTELVFKSEDSCTTIYFNILDRQNRAQLKKYQMLQLGEISHSYAISFSCKSCTGSRLQRLYTFDAACTLSWKMKIVSNKCHFMQRLNSLIIHQIGVALSYAWRAQQSPYPGIVHALYA